MSLKDTGCIIIPLRGLNNLLDVGHCERKITRQSVSDEFHKTHAALRVRGGGRGGFGEERAAGSVRCFRVPFCLFWILFNKREPGHFPPNNPPPLQKTCPTSGASAEPLGGDKRTSRRFTWWRRVEGGPPVCFVLVAPPPPRPLLLPPRGGPADWTCLLSHVSVREG